MTHYQFPGIEGLCSTLLQGRYYELRRNSIQVIFCKICQHWVVTSKFNTYENLMGLQHLITMIMSILL